MRKFAMRSLAGLLLLLLSVGVAYADNTAITLTSYSLFTDGQWSLGFEFIPNSNISVTTLGGFFPAGATDQHGVGLWDESATLLASTTVTGTGTEGFVYGAITPLSLTKGVEYIVSASTLSDAYALTFTHSFTVDPNITYVGHIEAACNTVAACFPTNRTTGFDDFGATFQFTTATVPEPTTLALMGTGLLGWFARRRFHS